MDPQIVEKEQNIIVDTIKRRYIHERAIYTWCGVSLIAINPYQEQDIYGDQVVETYHSASHSVYLQLDPHIYAVTEDAYSKLERNIKNQSIIVSGESGAGKTVSAKHAMRYLASIASSRAKIRVENRVLASNPIMEAIGNASTVRNDNSSRFGKYIQIYFDRHNRKILGANMRTYLLEKSRVVKQQSGERNFHIFYQLLNYAFKNPSKMAKLKLLNPDNANRMRKFNFLGNIQPHDTKDDLRKFNEALKILNIDDKRVDIIYRIIAAILHGGNIKFIKPADSDPDDDQDLSCDIDPEEFHFKTFCDLLGLDPELTRVRLTTKLLKTGAREVIVQSLNRQKAEYGRDAMLKYIYGCLFTWLVGLINVSLGSKELIEEQQQLISALNAIPKSPSVKKSILDPPQSEPQFIGVLDIYGFENFKTNSFEQFCINYANEVLQQQYNQHVFKLEQDEYMREGIDWTFIEYSDNQPVIDVIEQRPIGILNLLDEECRMPKGTDESWCAKLYDQLLPAGKGTIGKNTVEGPFRRPKINYQTSFTIAHYAEEVSYEVDTFLEKNRDTIWEEQSEMLKNLDIIDFMFNDPQLPLNSRPKLKTSRSATVGWQFRGSLAALIKTLNATEPHYIRCIKPNDDKKAFEYNDERAVQQLKACGVYETIRISNNGFPSRWLYRDFAKRYSVIIYGTGYFEQLAAKRREAQSKPTAQQAIGDDGQQVIIEEDEEDENHNTVDKTSNTGSKESLNSGLSSRSSKLSGDINRQTQQVAPERPQQLPAKFMCQFVSTDVRPICDAICKIAYQDSVYQHLRTKEEQAYIDKLIERHGNNSGAIYQFGKSKIFFRAGQVGYLERIRSQKLRGYTVTIQRHVRGWLARRAFALMKEEFLEQLKREASLASLQNQVNSLQAELEQAKEEMEEREESAIDEEKVVENVDPLSSMNQLVVALVYGAIQPLIISAVLEFEALDQPEPFASFESRSMTPTEQPMEDLTRELDKFHDLIQKNSVPEDIAVQAFKQVFYLIGAQSLNQLLIRRDLCQFNKAMQINFNISCLIQWCRERYCVHWREIVDQLDPITQATKLLQTRKSIQDIATIDEVCNKLRPSQIIKILNMYTSCYDEQITTEFIKALEDHLNETRHSQDDKQFMDIYY